MRLRGGPSSADHPRVRGEHWVRRGLVTSIGGSPPRTRGARRPHALLLLGAGITPAYAGSTPSARTPSSTPSDHPRVRGEHAGATIVKRSARGSPPRTRGALLRTRRHIRRDRITPAYAGSTCACRRRPARRQDHPRVRGEHAAGPSPISHRSGSPPRTRGARRCGLAHVQRVGITPAYAGSTPGARRWQGS